MASGCRLYAQKATSESPPVQLTGHALWSVLCPIMSLKILITLGRRLAEEGVRPDEVTTLESRNVLSLLSGKLGMSPGPGTRRTVVLLVRSCPIAPGIACPARSAS